MLYLLDCVEFTPEDIEINTATSLWVDKIRPTFDFSAEVSGTLNGVSVTGQQLFDSLC